ncbi:MAG TPA: hypothetical protein VKJ65_06885 [Phycisphaerae bacterium]|nr:hypothetical protein [Phycisphaerae bacterium]
MSDENKEITELASMQSAAAATSGSAPRKIKRVIKHSIIDIEIIRLVLMYLALVLLIAGIYVGYVLAKTPQRFGITAHAAAPWILASIAGGFILALPLLAVAMILKAHRVQIRQSAELAKSIDNMRLQLVLLESRPSQAAPAEPQRQSTSSSSPSEPSVPAAIESTDVSRVVELLGDMRDLLLMNDAQRQHRAARAWEQKKARLLENFHELTRQEQWTAATAVIERFRETLPGDPAADQLAAELTDRYSRRMQEDVDAYRREIEPLMSINSWDRVKELVARLEAKYPSQVQIAELASRIDKEYQIWRRDEFQRLLLEYKDAGDHRQWRRAYNIALQFSERFPGDKLVERIRLDMPTLQRNADIQDCQELVHQFKDLSQRHRYEEAYGVAERVIETFPDSMAATDLQKMLPKLQELIQQENAKRRTSAGQEIT